MFCTLPAEVQVFVRQRAAAVHRSCRRALRAEVRQVAVDHVVPIVVGPGTVQHLAHGLVRRVVLRVDAVVRGGVEVVAEVELDGRPAVAEDVVRDTDTRGEVVVAAHARCLRIRDGRGIEDGRLRRAVAVGRAVAPRAIVAERARERQPSPGPRVLHVEGGDLRVIGLLPVRQAERVRVRHAEVEAILHERLGCHDLRLGDEPASLIPDLHVVRAGHVRRRGAPVVRVAVVVVVGRDRAVHIVRARRIADAGSRIDRRRLLRHRDQVEDPVRRQLARAARMVVREAREAGLEQQLVRHRRRPGPLRQVVREIEVVGPGLGRGGRVGSGNPVGAAGVAAIGFHLERARPRSEADIRGRT